MPPIHSPLLTDFYQLTMAYGYWRLAMHEQEACFHLFFRKNPFKGNYALSCGLASAVDFLKNWRFAADDAAYLRTLQNDAGERHFPDDFIAYLANLTFSCDVAAIEEGTIIFPHTPILRVEGPLLQCQLIESPLLNILNFQTLIATKASRVCLAAADQPVIEFGMRRAQGVDGALSASRAAYIGGCVATSNTLAGKYFSIPLKGTHAHSWVSAFPTEILAFEAYASTMPQNCVLLVDTYDTLAGVENAIAIGKALRSKGADLLGIRLDSGDMAALSIAARKALDEAGFTKTAILASNSLDEYVICALKNQGAKINVWGVGTNLVTAYDQPALDGVYKLSALKNKQGLWEYKLKISADASKTSTPGRHQVRRFLHNGEFKRDVIFDLDLGIKTAAKTDEDYIDLLTPILKNGNEIAAATSIHLIRERAISAYQRAARMEHLADYPVLLDTQLAAEKEALIKKMRSLCSPRL